MSAHLLILTQEFLTIQLWFNEVLQYPKNLIKTTSLKRNIYIWFLYKSVEITGLLCRTVNHCLAQVIIGQQQLDSTCTKW